MTLVAETASATGSGDLGVQLRGASYTLLVLRVPDPKDEVFFRRLADKVAQAPNFYRHAPVVVDLQDLADSPPINMAELGRRLRQHWLVPIGVQNGTDDQNKAAVNAGFSLFPAGRETMTAASAKAPAADPESRSPAVVAAAGDGALGSASKIVTEPVRSGRQVYAHGGDLIVMASISPGAELLADGHIHVYGALRGRALAGVSGDVRARIFCRRLEAELVSIAGYWQVRDNLPDALIGQPAQIFLDGERVMIERLAAR